MTPERPAAEICTRSDAIRRSEYKFRLGVVSGGSIAHAEIEIGDSVVMVEDESPVMGTKPPPAGGFDGSPNVLFIYVEDVDATIEKAEKLGATVKRPAADQFYGDRDGFVVDPFGHGWTVATHVEDVAPDEMMRRFETLMNEGQP